MNEYEVVKMYNAEKYEDFCHYMQRKNNGDTSTSTINGAVEILLQALAVRDGIDVMGGM